MSKDPCKVMPFLFLNEPMKTNMQKYTFPGMLSTPVESFSFQGQVEIVQDNNVRWVTIQDHCIQGFCIRKSPVNLTRVENNDCLVLARFNFRFSFISIDGKIDL